jgi:threonine synthase
LAVTLAAETSNRLYWTSSSIGSNTGPAFMVGPLFWVQCKMTFSMTKPKPFPLIITMVAVVLCAFLGIWQLQRMAWKAELKERIVERIDSAPITLPPSPTTLENWDYQPVTVTGTFDHSSEVYQVAQSTRGNFGYQVITPLARADGSVVLVNRGWVPFENRQPETRIEGQVEGEVTITGIARLPWRQTGIAKMVAVEADKEQKIFFEGNIEGMAALHGLKVEPLFVNAGPALNPGALPKGGQTVLVLRDNHLMYAFSWFIFGFIALAIFVLFHRVKTTEGKEFMRYVSTRGRAPVLGFEDVVLAGLARDGGLYVPQTWPQIDPADFERLSTLSYSDLAVEIMYPFVEEAFSRDEFSVLVHESYETFNVEAVTPLRKLGDGEYLLELYHGPTFAFKDVALQLLGRLFEVILARRSEDLTIVGATSGDTGSAAIAACQGREGIQIFMLHPDGRVSDVQRRQMTTVQANNVSNVAIDGTFDDCQALVKALFNDHEFRDAHNLGAVNSVNWARVMAQVVYYFHAALSLGAADGVRPVFAVPTGNFGDVYAGYVATKMGLPVERLVVATNDNDILYRALHDGDYSRRDVRATISPAMDIQVSSNFERLLFDLFERDGSHVSALMDAFGDTGELAIPEANLAKVADLLDPHRIGEDEALATIKEVFERTGVEIDPHTAVGMTAGLRVERSAGTPLVVLSTAHPAKFPDAMEQALGHGPDTPEKLKAVMTGKEKFVHLKDDVDALKAYVEDNR